MAVVAPGKLRFQPLIHAPVLSLLQIMESSQTLLSVLKREQASLTKRRGL
jgi:hypothetical protein